MPITQGRYLGGINSLEALRSRCFVCHDCWHLRTASGRPVSRDKVHKVCVSGIGQMTASRAAWHLAGKVLPNRKGFCVYRVCESYDCVNPEHLRSGSRKLPILAWQERGYDKTNQLVVLKAQRDKVTKTTPEIIRAIVESPLSAPKLALQLPICAGRINAIRRQHRNRPASVFDLVFMADKFKIAA